MVTAANADFGACWPQSISRSFDACTAKFIDLLSQIEGNDNQQPKEVKVMAMWGEKMMCSDKI